MVHELAHMWFGDDVAPYEWSDVWLNEGHATWYQWTFAAEHGELAENFNGFDNLDDNMHFVYQISDLLHAQYGPIAQPPSGEATELFNPQVYWSGALTLYALRQKIGDAAFQRVERAWVSRYSGDSVSTHDFIALASRVSGQDLTAFLTAWLYGTKSPPMPGHPDWVAIQPADTAARAFAAPQLQSFALKALL
jgi:aminopeptidase N